MRVRNCMFKTYFLCLVLTKHRETVGINLIMKHIEQLLQFISRINRSASDSSCDAMCLESSRSSSPFERFGSLSSDSQEEDTNLILKPIPKKTNF